MILLLCPLLWMWFYGLLSIALIVLAFVLLYRASRKRKRVVVTVRDSESGGHRDTPVMLDGGANRPAVRNAMLTVGSLLLLFALMGRPSAMKFRPAGMNAPGFMKDGQAQTISRPDGTQLHVESYGPASGPVIILTHGWSMDHREWDYAKRDLSDRFRVIVWDLPGLGESTEPSNRDYSLDKMAADLSAVVDYAGKPVVLVGHSIGGMINLTYCRQHPEQLGSRVVGVVQVDTTYTNPVNTTKSPKFDKSLQKPVYEPLLHLTILTSPLVRALNWLSYRNGLAHLMTASSSFTGAETREQLDYAARRNYEASPAVVARGTLAMLHWDATPVLPKVRTQTLIIEGAQDSTTVPAASRFMRESMPAAELEMVDQAAHLGLLEQNRRYDDAIRRFAETCFARAAASRAAGF